MQFESISWRKTRNDIGRVLIFESSVVVHFFGEKLVLELEGNI